MGGEKTALVLGAAGGVGFETAKALARHGWRVRGLVRRPEAAPDFPEIKWLQGDAMAPEDVRQAAVGATIIVHAVNPPGYKDWDKLVLPMVENSIAAAAAVGARIILPGTIYNYGPDAFPVLSEASPQNPTTRKGAIRAEMERRLETAVSEGAQTVVLRAGDFFGPYNGNSWFTQALVKPGAPVKAVTYPGKRKVGHAWAYLPDFAETIARLADREAELAEFDTFHFAGHYFGEGVEFADDIRRAAGAEKAPIRNFPWMALGALSPFARKLRELNEMRYLWMSEVRLDNTKLKAFLGEEPHTPIDKALHASLEAIGCL